MARARRQATKLPTIDAGLNALRVRAEETMTAVLAVPEPDRHGLTYARDLDAAQTAIREYRDALRGARKRARAGKDKA